MHLGFLEALTQKDRMDASQDHLVSDVVIEPFEFTAAAESECKLAEVGNGSYNNKEKEE
ncbi:unnamed protein product [Schistocephalus solidus]|uniref:Ovule protein n=1 Tax=Schistocephalus solidus TaxID=70667 RepID=A0A183SXP0_SCHSO|nr:unnamed protein product [Schistocephalus solidus]